jgi:hypothetical protein
MRRVGALCVDSDSGVCMCSSWTQNMVWHVYNLHGNVPIGNSTGRMLPAGLVAHNQHPQYSISLLKAIMEYGRDDGLHIPMCDTGLTVHRATVNAGGCFGAVQPVTQPTSNQPTYACNVYGHEYLCNSTISPHHLPSQCHKPQCRSSCTSICKQTIPVTALTPPTPTHHPLARTQQRFGRPPCPAQYKGI